MCKAMLDNYCSYLYSPDVLGNLHVQNSNSFISVLQGETNNQFSQTFYKYAQAKTKNKKFLPRDLVQVLQKSEYFEKLYSYISRKPLHKMSLTERVDSEKLNYELGYIWAAAINETILLRMDTKYPGFHHMSEVLIPVELSLDRRRIRRNLISEISRAIWRDDKNWAGVVREFEELRQSFFRVISKLDIDKKVRDDWMSRMASVQIVLPGSIPAISDEECSTTNVNAYYYTHLNTITVCAGDFNSEDIIQTLAHEMAHALGIDRTQYLFEVNSHFGIELKKLQDNVCEPKKFTCDHWAEYKRQFENSLQTLDDFKPQVSEFESCLKRRPTSKELDEDAISKLVVGLTSDRISDLASSEKFLRITKAKLPLRNGKDQVNPNYLNPCSYSQWSQGEESIDDELTTLTYFTAEYRCSEAEDSKKIKNSIEVAKAMTNKVLQKKLKIEGEFSARNILESQGYSSPPYERFADVIGSYVMADHLQQIPFEWERRNRFLASSSWQCIEPSLASRFPAESDVEKQYVFDAHTEGDQRRKEFFSEPIRAVIGCKKDFEFNECKLKFK